MIVGERLKTIRETKKLSQGDIERRTGLLRCYISRVENGHTVPAIETLSPLDDVLDLIVAGALIRLTGWHWEFLPSFLAELVPGVNLVPFWTLAVLNVYRKWKQVDATGNQIQEHRLALR